MASSLLKISDIRIHAFHGCLEEEARIGTEFVVDVDFESDITAACEHDLLSETIDYVTVHSVVAHEMAIRSRLIEHVALRILRALVKTFPQSQEIRVRLTKLRPPINGGYLGKASVELSSKDF